MKEYIEREAIKIGMIKYGFIAPDMTVTEFVEDELPTADVVEVVRCYECKHWDRDWKSYISGENKHFCPMINLVTDADFFCKDGKCKGKGGDE